MLYARCYDDPTQVEVIVVMENNQNRVETSRRRVEVKLCHGKATLECYSMNICVCVCFVGVLSVKPGAYTVNSQC